MVAALRGHTRGMNDPKMLLWAGVILLAAGALTLATGGTTAGVLLLVGGVLMLVSSRREGGAVSRR